AIAVGRITPRPAVDLVAGVADRLCGPAEPALLIAAARARSATVGRRGVLAVRVVELALDAPDDIRRKGPVAPDRIECGLVHGERSGALEESEWILDLPDQACRHCRTCGEPRENT